ncbi:hypothetical protein [Thalassospira marina]|uniref:Uncharacterized protein n=1 Tax=Thalassospira marina TaxID=2048283 RepID=A0A2N3KTK5_9PROT|nr:hypothetical protein [Thalassospira marina]AUG55720.1 hypothetical protein CSC3H3_23010 [Thalassospira marina]PKR53885.1 hypothetical protein COO20_12830 [Thalassospira marina]
MQPLNRANEQGRDRKAPPIHMVSMGEALQRCQNVFVEWNEDGNEFAAFLPRDRGFDLLSACEKMTLADRAPIDSFEIWPMCRLLTQPTLNRLWGQVRRLREFNNYRMWSMEFARWGYTAGFER